MDTDRTTDEDVPKDKCPSREDEANELHVIQDLVKVAQLKEQELEDVLKAKQSELHQIRKKVDQGRVKMNAMRQERVRLEGENESLEKDVQDLQATLDIVTRTEDDMDELVVDIKNSNQRLVKDTEMNNNCCVFMDHNQSALVVAHDQANHLLQQSIEQQMSRIAKLSLRKEELSSSHETAVQKLRQDVQDKKNNFKERQADFHKLQSLAQTTKNDLIDCQNDLEILKTRKEELKREVQAKGERLLDMESEFTKKKEFEENCRSEIAKCQRNLLSLEEELKDKKAKAREERTLLLQTVNNIQNDVIPPDE